MKKEIKALAGICVLSSSLLSSTSFYNTAVKAEEKETVDKKVQKEVNGGLPGYYFSDDNFKNLDFILHNQTGDFSLDSKVLEGKEIKSAAWIGYLKPEETAEYVFSKISEQSGHVELWIDKKPVQFNTGVKLEKGKLYAVKLLYKHDKSVGEGKFSNLQLLWSNKNKSEEPKVIAEKNLLSNKPSEENKSRKKRDIIDADKGVKTKIEDDFGETSWLDDTDGDLIPDSWEINGYTITYPNIKAKLTKWERSFKNKLDNFGDPYNKYISSPYRKSTTGDPYSDYEKVTGQIDPSIDIDANNPLVAAYPDVEVVLDSFVLSQNKDISNNSGGSTQKTISTSKSNSNSHSNTTDIHTSIEAGIQNMLPETRATLSFGVTDSVGYEERYEKSDSHSNTEDWSKTIGLNTAASAFITPNVHYVNRGTAPVYNLLPQMGIGIGGKATHSISPQQQYIANELLPGNRYPEKKSLAINTKDEFGNTGLEVNHYMLKQLQNKENPLTVSSSQFDGEFGKIKIGNGGTLEIQPDSKWGIVQSNIESHTASIVVDTPEVKKTRRVYGRINKGTIKEKAPRYTLREALDTTFGIQVKNNNEIHINGKELKNAKVNLITDANTGNKIKEQLETIDKDKRDIFNTELLAGMNIKIKIYQDEKDMEKTEAAVKTEKTAIPYNEYFKWENPLEDTYTKIGYSESSPTSAGGPRLWARNSKGDAYAVAKVIGSDLRSETATSHSILLRKPLTMLENLKTKYKFTSDIKDNKSGVSIGIGKLEEDGTMSIIRRMNAYEFQNGVELTIDNPNEKYYVFLSFSNESFNFYKGLFTLNDINMETTTYSKIK